LFSPGEGGDTKTRKRAKKQFPTRRDNQRHKTKQSNINPIPAACDKGLESLKKKNLNFKWIGQGGIEEGFYQEMEGLEHDADWGKKGLDVEKTQLGKNLSLGTPKKDWSFHQAESHSQKPRKRIMLKTSV